MIEWRVEKKNWGLTLSKLSSIDKAYEHIRNLIISKKIFPGNQIIEETVIKSTGISRTSIRPALIRLEHEGLVEIVPYKGAFVAQPTVEDLKQVFKIRETLECAAFEEALLHRNEEDIAEMEKIIKAQEELKEHYFRKKYVELNTRFHWVIIKATKNKYYDKFLNEVYNKINSYMIFYDNSRDNNSSHLEIFEAFKKGDLEAGKKAILKDIQISLRDLGALDRTTILGREG